MTFVKTEPDIVRFMRNVQPEPNSGCWLWSGSLNGDGYGTFGVNGRSVRAHRWFYQHIRGIPLVAKQQLDHKCRVRCCVNPDHLDVVTNRENALRGAAYGTYGTFNRTKTHCPYGHEYTPSNTKIRRTGERRCRICDIARDRSRHYEARAALAAARTT